MRVAPGHVAALGRQDEVAAAGVEDDLCVHVCTYIYIYIYIQLLLLLFSYLSLLRLLLLRGLELLRGRAHLHGAPVGGLMDDLRIILLLLLLPIID